MADARPSLRYAVGGAVLVVLGLSSTGLFALQPWRSCPEDDVAAGCRALPQDTAGLAVGFIVLMVGLVLLLAATRRRRPRT